VKGVIERSPVKQFRGPPLNASKAPPPRLPPSEFEAGLQPTSSPSSSFMSSASIALHLRPHWRALTWFSNIFAPL